MSGAGWPSSSGGSSPATSAAKNRTPSPRSRRRSERGRSEPTASSRRGNARARSASPGPEVYSLAEPGEPETAETHIPEHLLRLRLDGHPGRAERFVHPGEDEVGERLRIVRVDCVRRDLDRDDVAGAVRGDLDQTAADR